jgi:hypothetical protein
MCPGVDSASKNEYRDTPGGKGGRSVRLTTNHLHVPIVKKSGGHNLLERCGPVQACNGAALPLLSKSELWNRCDSIDRSPTFRANRGFHSVTLLVINLAIREFCTVSFLFLVLSLIHEVSRSHNDAPHSVGLIWTSDQLVAETSTWQHTTITRNRRQCSRVGFEPVTSASERPVGSAFPVTLLFYVTDQYCLNIYVRCWVCYKSYLYFVYYVALFVGVSSSGFYCMCFMIFHCVVKLPRK